MSQITTEQIKNFRYAWYKNAAYSVNVKSYLTLGKGKANETETEEIWQIHPGEYGHMHIDISEKKYLKSDHQMKPFYEILDKVNDATNSLSLVLHEDKTINSIENLDEILHKWDDIKRKELRFLQLVKDSYNEMIEIYDREFERVEHNIKSNLLYQIMFYPFPEPNAEGFISEKMEDRTILSTLFPGETVDYSSSRQLEKTDAGYLMMVRGENSGHGANFETIYAEKYQPTMNIPLSYEMTLEGEYHYNEEAVLSEIVFHVREKLNESMLYVCRYHVQLLK